MKPVAIFRHAASEGPGLLADFLDVHAVPWTLIRLDAGEAVPVDTTAFSGLVLMGGPMSVNDDLPWIASVLRLVQEAVACNVPVLGHCLGGQLMARALGGVVTRNQVKEIGWGEVRVADHAEARGWFGGVQTFDAFHWHGETFSLPTGVTGLLSSAHCAHQGFALGPHLALQCHVEMTPAMIREWCALGAEEVAAASDSPAVQTTATMIREMLVKLPELNAVAHALYRRWLSGLDKSLVIASPIQ